MIGLTVDFVNTSTCEEPFTLDWQFGEGGTSTDRTPSDTYQVANATYQVTLTVINAIGSDTTSKSVTVQ